MQAMKEEQKKTAQKITESQGSAGASQQPQVFGTQIVNYKPNFVEKSDSSSDKSQDRSRERDISNGKRTFQGRNFAISYLQSNEDKVLTFQDQKENNNTSNIDLRLPPGSHVVPEDDEKSHDQSDSHIYDRLKSTRHHKKQGRGFSPPIKMTESKQRNYNKEIDSTAKKDFEETIKVENIKTDIPCTESNLEETHLLRQRQQSIAQSMDIDETIIVDGPEAIDTRAPQKLMKVKKVDLLRDSLDDGIFQSQGFENDLVKQIKEGALPMQTFCVVEGTQELIDV